MGDLSRRGPTAALLLAAVSAGRGIGAPAPGAAPLTAATSHAPLAQPAAMSPATGQLQVPANAQPLDPRTTDALRLAQARKILASPKALTITVLGDSVGNDPGEWVSKWAQSLAADRVVTVRHFDWQKPGWFERTEVFAPDHETTKAQITVWNFGWPGGTPLRAAQHLRLGVPTKPDLAIVSFGHNLGPGAVVPHYEALDKALKARWGAVPTVTTLAHMTPVARPGQAQGRVLLLRWLRARGLPYIDERGVFDTALAEQKSVFHDAVHPNWLGYRLISDLIEASLSEPEHVTRPAAAYSPSRMRADVVSLSRTRGTRTTAFTATYSVRGPDGRPFAHAWVLLRLTGPGGTTTSIETDARGRATGAVKLATGSVGTLTATATDGIVTVTSRPRPVSAR